AWVSSHFLPGEQRAVTAFFNLVLAHNTGAAFSLLAQAGGWQRLFFIAVALVATTVIVWLLHRHRHESRFCIALAGILGGALGNLIDRVRLGYVVDFLDFHAAGWHWPAFNVADMAITGGAVLLVWDSLRREPRGK
ncbi:MAG: signal peptidase II, partial [Burkholderiales bacterium]